MNVMKNRVETFYKSCVSGFAVKSLLTLSLVSVFAFATQSNKLEIIGYHSSDHVKLEGYSISAAYVTNCDACSENTQVQVKDDAIIFDANRHDSVATVAFAQQQLSEVGISWSANNMLGALGTTVTEPTELNFFLEGTLQLNYNGTDYVCNNYMVAQGHNGGNNWWGFTNSSASLPSIPEGDIWASYPVQCDVSGIPGNTQTLWFVQAEGDSTFGVTDAPVYGPGGAPGMYHAS